MFGCELATPFIFFMMESTSEWSWMVRWRAETVLHRAIANSPSSSRYDSCPCSFFPCLLGWQRWLPVAFARFMESNPVRMRVTHFLMEEKEIVQKLRSSHNGGREIYYSFLCYFGLIHLWKVRPKGIAFVLCCVEDKRELRISIFWTLLLHIK